MKAYHALGQFWYSILMILLSFGILAVFTVTYVGHAINQNNRPFCAVIVTITEPRPTPPERPDSGSEPATTTGAELVAYQKALEKYNKDNQAYNQRVSNRLHDLSKKYNC